MANSEFEFLVQIFANDTDNDPCIGTGYSIGSGLILTARHVVIFDERAKTPNLTIVWPENSENPIPFSDDDIIYKGSDEFDIAVIRCPEKLPFEPSQVILATRTPNPGEEWYTRGFLRAGKKGNKRESKGIPGKIAGEKNQTLELTTEVEVTQKNGWAGISGAPVLVDKELVAVITDKYTTINKYLESVSIPHLLQDTSSGFKEAVKQKTDDAVQQTKEIIHNRVCHNLTDILEKQILSAKRFAKALALPEQTSPADIAERFTRHMSAGKAIDILAQEVLHQSSKQPGLSQKDWDEFMEDVEQFYGWLLINSMDPKWCHENELRLKNQFNRKLSSTFTLDYPAYYEVIISQRLKQRACYTTDKYGDIKPAGMKYDVMLYDGYSTEATDIQLLSSIFEDLRPSYKVPTDDKKLFDSVVNAVKGSFGMRDNKPIYYLVTDDFLSLIKDQSWFKKLEKELLGYLHFLCIEPLNDPSSQNPCREKQRDLLAKVEVILGLDHQKRVPNE